MIIPTKNYVTYTTLARMNIQTGHPVLLVGQRSCGKTVVMRKVISEMRKVCNMRVFSTAFSTRTNPLDFQHILESKLERRGRALLTGPNYKPAAIVIEDMHLPTVFDSPPHGFLYDYQSEYKMHEPYTRFDVSSLSPFRASTSSTSLNSSSSWSRCLTRRASRTASAISRWALRSVHSHSQAAGPRSQPLRPSQSGICGSFKY